MPFRFSDAYLTATRPPSTDHSTLLGEAIEALNTADSVLGLVGLLPSKQLAESILTFPLICR